jgi:sporulation protein YlmC with PRC-barrel domain
MLGVTDATQIEGADVVDESGDKIGSVSDIYLDDETNQPEFALVTSGLFGTKHHFVPLRDAELSGDQLRVPYGKDQVKNAPSIDADGQLSQEEEQDLYSYYGLPYSEARSDTGLPQGGAGDVVTAGGTTGGRGEVWDSDAVGRDTSGPTTDDAMTRSEEELTVGTREQEAGRVRLRKHVTTENVSETVPVRHEEARVRAVRAGDLERGARGQPHPGGAGRREAGRAQGARPPREGDDDRRGAGEQRGAQGGDRGRGRRPHDRRPLGIPPSGIPASRDGTRMTVEGTGGDVRPLTFYS